VTEAPLEARVQGTRVRQVNGYDVRLSMLDGGELDHPILAVDHCSN
jgi:hypothetical protein